MRPEPGNPQSGVDCVEHPRTFSNHIIAEIAMCYNVNFDPKNQSWSFWSHNHETSIKMWKRACPSNVNFDPKNQTLEE